MDTWFTQQPLIQSIVEIGLDVIGMVKAMNQRYLVNHQKLSLKALYKVATPVSNQKGILCSVHTTMANGIPVKVVFVQNRNKKSEWLAILSTIVSFLNKKSSVSMECVGILRSSLKRPNPYYVFKIPLICVLVELNNVKSSTAIRPRVRIRNPL